MATVGSGTVRQGLATLFGVGAIGRLGDAELLGRFVEGRGDAGSEAAFAALVARHGPMVRGACLRVLGDSHAADDAFQATFLVLARKARSVRVDDSLGRWLYGVSVRVALRAKAVVSAERRRVRRLEGIEVADRALATAPAEREDLRRAIDEEIARLPARHRAVVVSCLLEGLTQEQAARRLRCPLGTIQSRLHRARGRLGSRLARRGLAPTAVGLASALRADPATASVPPGLATSTAAAAARLSAGGAIAGMVPAGASALAAGVLGRLGMMNVRLAAIGGLSLGLLAVGAGVLAQQSRGGRASEDRADAPAASAGRPAPKPEAAARLRSILSEWDEAQRVCFNVASLAKDDAGRQLVYGLMAPDLTEYTRRLLDLAEAEPDDPSARDALLWIVRNGTGRSDDQGPWASQFGEAVDRLIRHHADDPQVARTALLIDNLPSPNRDRLFRSLYERATDREAKGTAALALAQYLVMRAKLAEGAAKSPSKSPPRFTYPTQDADGHPISKRAESMIDEAYWEHLRSCEPEALRREAEDLFELVIDRYGDVPFVRGGGRESYDRARKTTLAQVAEGRLDEMHHLAVGQPAPEIDGVDLDGKPLKLSDHRGKVVVLVFWGSWCGPCMREVPHERELAERMKGRPFALLGVDCDPGLEAGRRAAKEAGITWPNWHDGDPGEGPIARRYHVRGYPSVFVIDPRGIIRHKEILGPGLDRAVDDLVKDAERAAAAKSASSAPAPSGREVRP
jgi:RNA polymerase sigma factor (sigma-70 family)